MSAKITSLDVLKLREFRLLLFSRIFLGMALQAQAVIVGWQIYSMTGDPFLLGLSGLIEAIPAVGCALFAGHFVDTRQPRRIYAFCLGTLFVNTVALLLLGGGIVAVPKTALLVLLYTGIFISGVTRSFISPSAFSLRAQALPARYISPGAALWSGGLQLAQICGPAFAGIIYGLSGARGAWIFPTILTFCAFTLSGLSRLPDVERAPLQKNMAIASIKEGWEFMLGQPVLLGTMTVDMFAVLFGGAVAMLPAFAAEILHVGSEGLGMLRAAPAIGAVTVAAYLALKPMQKLSTERLLWVVVGFGLCMIGFGLSNVFWLSMAFLILSGAFDSVSMVIRGAIVQLLTPENMRGRVSSVSSMFIFSSNEIGAFESGVAAKLMGLVPSVVFGGFCTLMVSGVTAWVSPAMRRTYIDASGDVIVSK